MSCVLVTGGCGFIGSNFIRWLLEDDPEVRVVNFDKLTYAGNLDNIDPSLKSNGNFQFHHGNITRPDIVNKLVSEANIVVHFAAESHVTRSIYDNAIFFLFFDCKRKNQSHTQKNKFNL